ncbi:DinB family protein [Paenimyroides aestuarii]|uniref:DinB family protein n=1 Tax=Paenimyroides aestuarii TaxID=2968490 RepID=A0ABY5NS94_9FLAO|nr:DinB family protein [Paenimyroides aestuarii]UUV21239.1 DinB family protein [Paenimyroides aestuarii]
MKANIVTNEELLNHWQGHRTLTRKVIEAFPEKELFEYSIGGMRTFADLVKELLSIAVPGLEGIVNNTTEAHNHNLPLATKADLLNAWDEATPKINALFMQISEERFQEEFNLFGAYKFPVLHNILYFIDNEVHHRGQGYVYLRSLGIEPPFFWERS